MYMSNQFFRWKGSTAVFHLQNSIQFLWPRFFQPLNRHTCWWGWWGGWGWLVTGHWAGTLPRRWRRGRASSWSGFGTGAQWPTLPTTWCSTISASVTRVPQILLLKLHIPMWLKSMEPGFLRWESLCCSFLNCPGCRLHDRVSCCSGRAKSWKNSEVSGDEARLVRADGGLVGRGGHQEDGRERHLDWPRGHHALPTLKLEAQRGIGHKECRGERQGDGKGVKINPRLVTLQLNSTAALFVNFVHLLQTMLVHICGMRQNILQFYKYRIQLKNHWPTHWLTDMGRC